MSAIIPLFALGSILETTFTLLGVGVGIYGIILSLKQKKIPLYRCRTTRLVSNDVMSIDGLDVFYKGEKMSSLSLSKLVFWNGGRKAISYSDVSECDKLRIEIDDGFEILSCTDMKAKDVNLLTTRIEDGRKSIILSFDFLNCNEGALLRIIHTGEGSSNISLKGRIKGVEAIRIGGGTLLFKGTKYQEIISSDHFIIYLLTSIITVGVTLLFFFRDSIQWWSLLFFGILEVSYIILTFLSSRRRIPKCYKKEFYSDDL